MEAERTYYDNQQTRYTSAPTTYNTTNSHVQTSGNGVWVPVDIPVSAKPLQQQALTRAAEALRPQAHKIAIFNLTGIPKPIAHDIRQTAPLRAPLLRAR